MKTVGLVQGTATIAIILLQGAKLCIGVGAGIVAFLSVPQFPEGNWFSLIDGLLSLFAAGAAYWLVSLIGSMIQAAIMSIFKLDF